MYSKYIVKIFWLLALAGCSMGGCKCSRDVTVEDQTDIDNPDMVEVFPDAPRPDVVFPDKLRQADATLNEFIIHALRVCHRGDYDAFRQLFGTAYDPTSQSDFNRVWEGVHAIEIQQLHAGLDQHYYLLAKVRLRKPDSKDRQERDVPVMVFREAGQWRLGPAPQKIIEKMRALETRPASRPGNETFH